MQLWTYPNVQLWVWVYIQLKTFYCKTFLYYKGLNARRMVQKHLGRWIHKISDLYKSELSIWISHMWMYWDLRLDEGYCSVLTASSILLQGYVGKWSERCGSKWWADS
jgi:hypothetical protein